MSSQNAASPGEQPIRIGRNIQDIERLIRGVHPLSDLHLGDILVEEGVIDAHQLTQALERQHAEPNKHIGQILEEMGAVTHEQVSRALGRKFGIPFVSLEGFEIDPAVLAKLPSEVALQYTVLPLGVVNRRLVVAMENPLDWAARDVVQFYVSHNVEAVIASRSEIEQTLSRYYSEHETVESLEALELSPATAVEYRSREVADVEKEAMRKPVVRLLNAILLQAVVRGASDINIRPDKDRVNIYYRVDGKEQFVRSLQRSLLAPLISRIKITGQMNIAEHYLPQDGHARLKRGEKSIDLRISVIPTINGESAVIRVLDKQVGLKSLDGIGFKQKELETLRRIISRPHGIFLVTGPTGSGKSTTLYALLNEIKAGNPHIITVEDPVEYDMGGIEQIQISVVRGYTFAEALRHILRHDPDVVMIGEIRDLETARIAIKAALTGHLVLSTLHTNDAPSAITRLMDMSIEPYLIGATTLGTMAQRLIRLNCEKCVAEDDVAEHIRRDLGLEANDVFYKGSGCPVCNYTGYRGRVAVCELMPVGPDLRPVITAGRDAQAIKKSAVKHGMNTLAQNALELARAGKTSIEEVYTLWVE